MKILPKKEEPVYSLMPTWHEVTSEVQDREQGMYWLQRILLSPLIVRRRNT